MLILLIGAFFGIGAIMIWYDKEKEENKNLSFSKFWIMATVCFAFVFAIGVSNIGYLLFNDTYTCDKNVAVDTVIEETKEIISLQDKDAEKGKYVGVGVVGTGVYSGYNETKTYYCWYYKTEYGYKYNKLSPEDTDVYINYCQDNETPTIQKQYDIITKQTILERKPNIWKSDIFSYLKYQNYNVGDVVVEEDNTKKYLDTEHRNFRTVIYIPKGSIQENYTIDME